LHDEQIAGLALGDQLCEHPRICAGDEQSVRGLLALRQPVKQLPVPPEFFPLKLVNACDEFLHEQPGAANTGK